MKRRRMLVIIILFGSACIIVLSLSGSSSLKFMLPSNVLLPEKGPHWSHQVLSRLNNGEFAMDTSDVHASNSALNNEQKDTNDAGRCPSILAGMVKGKWIRRPLTQHEQTTIDAYLQKERGFYRIPPSYQRNDGRCGDLPYDNSPLYPHMWFKAICNPKGETPCCHTNKCVNLSELDCRCPTCYDERTAIHAEYAQWKTEDDRCEVKNFTTQEACTVLNGTTLHFVGDSFIRHVFISMVVVLTNNPEGALKKSTPQHYRDQCKGMYQITWSNCKDYMEMNRSLCGGNVKVAYTQVFPAKEFSLTPPLLHELRHINKSIVVLGLGIHNNFDVRTVAQEFLFPFLSLHQALTTNTTINVSLENILPTLGHFSASPSGWNINTHVDNAPYRTVLPNYENYRLNDILGSFGRQMNQLNSYISFLKAISTKQAFNANSTLDIHGNQQNVQLNTSNTTVNNINNSQMRKNYTNVGQTTNRPDTINLNFRKFHNIEVDKSVKSNLSRIRRDADTGIVSPVISQTMPQPGVEVSSWPRLVWIGTHAPGLLKSFKFKEQTAAGVLNFNKNIFEILNHFKVPYLDTFDFTDGTVSFDGTHYGWGINMLKVNMLLTYIQREFADDPDWR